MPERIVVAFRGVVPATSARGPGYIERAFGVKKVAEAHGATLCAWGAQAFAFELMPEDLEEAIALATAVVGHASTPLEERFSVGITLGPVTPIGEAGPFATLAWGRPLVTAVQLANLARPGEVLVDRDLPAVASGELLSTGSRAARRSTGRVRGVLLDVAEPWRRNAAHHVARLVEPPLVGPLVDLDPVVPLGCLVTVRGARGAGGTRALAEIAARIDPARVIAITPAGASMEPLGALRRALARAAATEPTPPLGDAARATLGKLLAGEGVDLAAAAELVDAWLAPAGDRAGLLTIDDATEVDEASLEAVADAVNRTGAFRALARIDDAGPLPVPLAGIPAGPPIALLALDGAEATTFVQAVLGGACDVATAARWARRGGGSPLALREAVAEGLVAGDLAWSGARATPRRRAAGRGATESARHFLDRRVKHLGPDEHALLSAIALLGGDASEASLDALLARAHRPGLTTARVADAVIAAGLASRPEPGWLRLSSRTARDALVAGLAPEARALAHRAACDVLTDHAGPLARAEAAWHAAHAGDGARAAKLAVDAARAAMRAGLDGASLALVTFARAHDEALAEKAYLEVRAVASLRPPPARPDVSSIPPSYPDPTTRPAPRIPPRPSARPAPVADAAWAGVPLPPLPEDSPRSSVRAPGSIGAPRAPRISAPPLPAPRAPLPLDPGPHSQRRPPVELDDEATHELPLPMPRPSAAPPAPPATRAIAPPPSSAGVASPRLPAPSSPGVASPRLPAPSSPGVASPRAPAPSSPGASPAPAPVAAGSTPRSSRDPSSAAAPGSGPSTLVDPGPPPSGHDPVVVAGQLAEEARRALVRRDVAALEGLITRMRATGENDELVERMSAMVALGRGAKAEALSKLRQAAEAPELAPPHRPRARLAYSVALAAAGRREAALLEALTALARARELGDRHGEHACARFLARLAAAAGHPSAASTWARVARLAAAPTPSKPG